jgi:hypothetical protein
MERLTRAPVPFSRLRSIFTRAATPTHALRIRSSSAPVLIKARAGQTINEGRGMDYSTAQRLAEDWYAAWNAHDLDAILDHYADDVEMASPLVSRLTGKDDGRIVGKEALRAYFAAGLARYPTLHFEPLELFVGVGSLVLHYRSANGAPAAEVIFLDEQAKIVRYFAHYAG